MKKTSTSFSELRELLLELGFREKAPTRFEHPATKTILLFGAHDAHDAISDRAILVVRRQLVDNGLIEPSAFDHFLAKVSA